MNTIQLTASVILLCISISGQVHAWQQSTTTENSTDRKTKGSQSITAFGIQLGSKLEKSKVIGNEILAGDYRTVLNLDGSFTYRNDMGQIELQKESSYLPIYRQVNPSSPSAPFTHYYVGLTPRSSVIYKIVAVNYDGEQRLQKLEEQEKQELQKLDEEFKELQASAFTQTSNEERNLKTQRKTENLKQRPIVMDRYLEEKDRAKYECGTSYENLSHILGKKYTKGYSELYTSEYFAGQVRIYLACKGGRLKIVYHNTKLEKQRDLELDQIEKQIMDRKTKDIDSSKF